MENVFGMDNIRVLMGLLVLVFVGCACADALEFSGEVVRLTGEQTEDIVWNESNFGGFCYDLGDGVCAGTETLSIAAGTLTGPDVDRTIDESNLIYTTHPIWREYELHKNLGLTLDSSYYDRESGYWIEFWIGEMYVAIDGRADKLAKPLVEFNSTDTRTLVVGKKWNIGGGFALEAKQIDLDGEKVWLCLYRDGKEIDNEVIDTGDFDLQDRVYTYTEDLAGEDDVPIFSCYVSAVFRGTCSNIVQVKYVFLIDDVIEIDTGEEYGAMEVTTASSSGITLSNDDTIIGLNPGTTTLIMGDLSLTTRDNTGAIEFYPHLVRDEPPVLSGGGGFVLDDCWIGQPWDISEDYYIAAKDVSLDGDKARIVLLKNGVVIDERVLTEESVAPVDSDCRYRYVKDGIEVINATLKAAFRGSASNAVELGEVYQHSEDGGSVLINNETHLFKSADPTGIPWDIAGGYVLTMKDVGVNSEVWLELSKNGITAKETVLKGCSAFTHTSGAGGMDCMVDRVFRGCEVNAVKLVDVNQYSDVNGTTLIVDGSHFYRSADPDGISWELSDGYVLTMKDIEVVDWYYGGGDKVWLELSRDGNVLEDDILESGDLFTYETGIEIVNCTVDSVFHGTLGDVVKLADVNQYSATGRQLIDRGSKTFAIANPTGEIWELHEGYSLDAKDIDLYGNKAWLSLSTNGMVVKDAVIDYWGRYYGVDKWFKYYNSTGALVFSAYVDAVFRDNEGYVVQLMYATQYSEIDGSVLMEFGESEKKTLSAGTATTILPLIISPIDGQIFVEGDTITFSASASDGTPPYSYRWYGNGDVIGTGNSFDTSFGTGSHIITLIVNDAAGASVSERVRVRIGLRRGDVNQDGIITSTDAVIVLQMAARGEWDRCADVSGDGEVTSLDALMILQMAAMDRTPPEITLVNDSIGVNEDIAVSFSETIDISTLCISVIGPYHGMTPGRIICDDNMKGALFDPDNPLQIGEHSVRVKCRDPSDNLAEQEFVLMVVGEDEPEPNTSTKIVINELMPNPIGRDYRNETTELYNCGDEPVDIGGWVIKNEDGDTYEIPAGTTIDAHGYYLTTKIQLDNSGGQVLLYHDGEEIDRSIEYTHSTEGLSWQRRTDGLDTDSDGNWLERDPTFGVVA